MRRLLLPAAVALALLTGARGAAAQVTCTVSATTLAFGGYIPFNAAATDGVGTINLGCTVPGPGNSPTTVSYSIALSGGGSGDPAARRMLSGTNQLTYQLYRDAARTLVWGNTAGQVLTGSGTVRRTQPLNRAITVYGRIPARQNARVGSYADTITVTVTY